MGARLALPPSESTPSEADALLIATPEYNRSLGSALKNAIDWASRSPQPPLRGMPVGIIGASIGNFGTLRSQLHLRQILTHVGALPMGKPEVLVARAEQAFDAGGKLIDEAAGGFLRNLLDALAVWTRRVSRARRLEASAKRQQAEQYLGIATR
jgi:chromate reductase